MRDIEKNILSVLGDNVAEYLKHKSKCRVLDISLLGGDFGCICFLYQYSRYNTDFNQKADILLEKALINLPNYAHIGSYCNGLSGFALALLFLEEDKLIEDASIAISKLDPAIKLCFKRQLRNNDIDFLHGIIGYGFYFLERLKSSQDFAIQGLTDIVNHLYNVRHKIDDMITWELGKPDVSCKYNISLSHGMSSISILLSRITQDERLSAQLRAKAKELLRNSVKFIVAQQLDRHRFNIPNIFPLHGIGVTISLFIAAWHGAMAT